MANAATVIVGSCDLLLLDIIEFSLACENDVVRIDRVSSVGALISAAEQSGARVAVLDFSLAPLDDLQQAVGALLAENVRTLVFGSHRYEQAASTLLLAGASGLLYVEDAGLTSVASAIRKVAAGHTALHPSVAKMVFDQWRDMRSRAELANAQLPLSDRPGLSEREKAVLIAVARGITSRIIAQQLGVAEKTVEAHRARIYAKLGARNQAHAVQIAAARGLLRDVPLGRGPTKTP